MSSATGIQILHASWWIYGLLAAAAVLLLIYLFAPEVLKQILDLLGGILPMFGALLLALGKFFFQLAGLAWSLWCLGFAFRWRFQHAIRFFFRSTARGVLLASSGYLLAELTFVILHGLKHALPAWYANLTALVSSRFPTLYAHLSAFHMPRLHEIPFSLELALLFLAFLMSRHHLREFFASLRREAVPPALEELFLEFDKFRKGHPTPNRAAKHAFLEILLLKLKQLLDEKNDRDVAFGLLEQEEVLAADKVSMTKTGFLVITFLPKDSPLDGTRRIPIGKGGAGKAFQEKVAIYIPSVRHQIGIDLDHDKSVGLIYYSDENSKDEFRSVLSVPVLVNATSDAIAVLAVSSKKSKAFGDPDFEIVRLAASIVSTLY